MKIINFYIYIILLNIFFCQKIITNPTSYSQLLIEYNSISNNNITEELFYTPYIEKMPSHKNLNLFKSLEYNHYFMLEPVLSLRYSSHGMGMYTTSSIDNTDSYPEIFNSQSEAINSLFWRY